MRPENEELSLDVEPMASVGHPNANVPAGETATWICKVFGALWAGYLTWG